MARGGLNRTPRVPLPAAPSNSCRSSWSCRSSRHWHAPSPFSPSALSLQGWKKKRPPCFGGRLPSDLFYRKRKKKNGFSPDGEIHGQHAPARPAARPSGRQQVHPGEEQGGGKQQQREPCRRGSCRRVPGGPGIAEQRRLGRHVGSRCCAGGRRQGTVAPAAEDRPVDTHTHSPLPTADC